MILQLQDFVTQLRNILDQINLAPPDQSYVNLAEIDSDDTLLESLESDGIPSDPLIDAFQLILSAIANLQVDFVKYGINEICKTYIRLVSLETEKDISLYFLKRLELIFQSCLHHDFPYHNEVWNYLGGCLNTVGLFLFEHRLEYATKELLQTFFHMGRLAAQQGLQTSSTQAYFRILENKAREQGFEELAANAKNFRFNLELY